MSDGGPVIRIVGGGAVDEVEHTAIFTAVTRLGQVREDAHRSARTSAWALAGRLEAVGMATVRARSSLPRG